MSIFGDILSKIIPAGLNPANAAAVSPTTGIPSSIAAPTPAAGGATAGSSSTVDVAKVLGDLARKNGQNLNWKSSIVDLMKLLDLDSSLTARKQLAKELGFTGDGADSAAMNMWLQKEVMKKLADNGGKVPPELMH